MFVLTDLSKKCETLLDFREVGSMAYFWVFRIKIFWNDFKFIVFFTASYFFFNFGKNQFIVSNEVNII